MNSRGTCAECRSEAPKSKKWKAVGEPVVCRVSVGRGYDQTEHSFYQCSECGSLWVKYEDSEAGGHGTFRKRLTEGLF